MKSLDRITAIRQSLTAFVWGLLAVPPVIGFIPAIIALTMSMSVQRRYHDWNPAERYLRWSVALGLFGVLNSLLAGVVIAYMATMPVNPCD